MRGLKRQNTLALVRMMTSHLLQMRGLKLYSQSLSQGQLSVASFTDAWIETFNGSDMHINVLVASFTDAWIETYSTEDLEDW